MTARRASVFALAAPVVAWLAIIVIGGKRGDAAGLMFVRPGPVPLPSGLALATAAGGLLAAYLTAKS